MDEFEPVSGFGNMDDADEGFGKLIVSGGMVRLIFKRPNMGSLQMHCL
ncbi:hypothetical protein GGQ88_001904 [Novosphingobium hassiacum]|uniref:Uncharacterized protein n=1 Tax=Novosphingobium hassiacum TaxID=173676 RepID=A0A7W5ZWY0_9SPHN|nr:hypothetical protein [Novosphingobium hassiacum]MBB3860638.1 hypothetical protein [Novosphingobium hassiacum]